MSTSRAAIYARISRDRAGAGLGVQTQEADCRELAATLGARIVDVHVDNDISAYSGKPRPGYRQLLDDVASGRVDVVLVWHTDRLHRSPTELEHYISVCEPRGVATHTVKSGPIDLATPSGRLVARQLGSVARYEVEHSIERQKRAKLRSAQAGKWKGGRRPFGYEADGVTIREPEAQLLREAADAILAGASVRGICAQWNAAGMRTPEGSVWKAHGPRRVLIRPRTAGLMQHQGEVIGVAEWSAIIDPVKWEAVRAILTDPSRRTNVANTGRRWLGSGIYRCGICGGTVITTMTHARRSYRCNDGHVSRLRESVDQYVEAVIMERLRRPDLAELLASADHGGDVAVFEAKAIELRERLDQLAGVFARGEIDSQQLTAGSRSLNAEMERIREQISDHYRDTVLDGIGTAPDPGAAWLDAPLDRKRAVLDTLVTVTLLPGQSGRPPGWQPGEPYFRPELVRIEWSQG